MAPGDVLNQLLPFMDAQQALCALIWFFENNIEEGAEKPLRELLKLYPFKWAFKKLNWPEPNETMDESYCDKESGEEGAWAILLKGCVACGRKQEFDFAKIPSRVNAAAEALEARLTTHARSAVSRDGRGEAEREAVVQLVWLAHWVMWLLMKYHYNNTRSLEKTTGWTDVIDFLFGDRVLQAVTLIAPHLLRYYVVLVLPIRRKHDHVKCLTTAITNHEHRYQDSFTRFLTATMVELNLDSAQKELNHFQTLCTQDYFLVDIGLNVCDSARLLVCDHYCRIHKYLNVSLIDKLHLNSAAAEEWIVNLIKEAKLDAKIDSGRGVIEMTTATTNTYASILDKTRSLLYRTNSVIQPMEKQVVSR